MSRSAQKRAGGFKSHLPTRDCATCGRPFSWRKKWTKNWEEVRYCSERCRRQKNKTGAGTNKAS